MKSRVLVNNGKNVVVFDLARDAACRLDQSLSVHFRGFRLVQEGCFCGLFILDLCEACVVGVGWSA